MGLVVDWHSTPPSVSWSETIDDATGGRVNVSVFYKSRKHWRTVNGLGRDAASFLVAALVRDPDVGFVTVDGES